MTTEELYVYVQDLVNKNSSGRGADITKGWFVDAYNINSKRYVASLLHNRNDDLLRTISNLRTNSEIDSVSIGDIYNEYEFPENYFDFINVTCIFTNDSCKSGVKSQVMTEIKPENLDILYNDPFNEPSLKHAETLYNTYGQGMYIYKKGFEIKDVTLYYYKKPSEIDMVGNIKLDGSESNETVDPDLSDQALIEIGLMMAKQFSSSTDDYNKASSIMQTQQFKK